jgi:hypothetical protein
MPINKGVNWISQDNGDYMIFVDNTVLFNEYPNVYTQDYHILNQYNIVDFPKDIGITISEVINSDPKVKYWFIQKSNGEICIEFEEWFPSNDISAQLKKAIKEQAIYQNKNRTITLKNYQEFNHQLRYSLKVKAKKICSLVDIAKKELEYMGKYKATYLLTNK